MLGKDHLNHDIIAEPFAEYLQVHPNLFTAHRHSFYHIVLFTKGKGYHTIDFEKFDVVAGQIYFMSPGQVHSWNFKGEVDGYVINFSESILHSFLANEQYMEQFTFFRSIAQDSVFNLKAATFATAKNILKQVTEEAHQRNILTTDLVCALLLQLFITVQRSITNNTTNTALQQNALILHNFRKLVNAYYAEKRLPKEYAAMLYITPNHLNALCKDLLGKPSGELIRDRILLEAKRLLVNADLGIAQIAAQLQFSDNSHFTKFLKNIPALVPKNSEGQQSPVDKQQYMCAEKQVANVVYYKVY